MLYLRSDLSHLFSNKLPLFPQVMALRGEVFRDQKGRVTQRVRLDDKYYFIKQHHGVGWKEIFKNLLQLKMPVLGAKNEWQAIQKLQSLAISVPILAGFGEQGKNWARKESFILMEEITPSVSLETLCANWGASPPDVRFKRRLIDEVARIARIMHAHGINHRDFYICHFLLDKESSEAMPRLYLIDLHRAAIRKRTPTRWLIKDLAGLYFSSKECGLTKRDLYRFMCAYRQLPLRKIMKDEKSFWEQVYERGEKLYRDHSK